MDSSVLRNNCFKVKLLYSIKQHWFLKGCHQPDQSIDTSHILPRYYSEWEPCCDNVCDNFCDNFHSTVFKKKMNHIMSRDQMPPFSAHVLFLTIDTCSQWQCAEICLELLLYIFSTGLSPCLNGCVNVCAIMPCDWLAPCPGCLPPCALSSLG